MRRIMTFLALAGAAMASGKNTWFEGSLLRTTDTNKREYIAQRSMGSNAFYSPSRSQRIKNKVNNKRHK